MMKFVTIQPDNLYFDWQLKVLHQNMRELEMFNDSVTIIGYNRTPSAWAIELKNQHPDKVFLIQDTRSNRDYVPSIRPHLLKKFVHLYPSVLDGHNWMYHDCDILFTKKFYWDSVVIDDKLVYMSDTISYIGAEYIQSKGKGLLEEMCAIVGIEPSTVIVNESSSGGAQIIFGKNFKLSTEFWDKVEADSTALFSLMNKTKAIYTPEYPIQSWTADMWSTLWNIWKVGYDTVVIPEMTFSWPDHEISEFYRYNIFHNAGVTVNEKHLFYKAEFLNTSPFGRVFNKIDKTKCSYKYVQMIDRAHKNNLKMNYRMN